MQAPALPCLRGLTQDARGQQALLQLRELHPRSPQARRLRLLGRHAVGRAAQRQPRLEGVVQGDDGERDDAQQRHAKAVLEDALRLQAHAVHAAPARAGAQVAQHIA